MGLDLAVLRDANTARLPQFLNAIGYPAHSAPDGSDWTPAQWLQALVGELGEYANFRKKFERGDITFLEFKIEAEKELADVLTYLDLLAKRCLDITKVDGQNAIGETLIRNIPDKEGVDLSCAVVEKFNRVSKRVNSSIRMDNDSWWIESKNKAP